MRAFSRPSPDLDGRSVLVTGGTGSFGQQLVRTLLERYRIARLVVFSRDELKQYEMARRFDVKTHPCLRYFIGDVRDRERLSAAARGIDVVVHAAALKQVPVAEYNPMECIRTNVNGAENVACAALENGVERVIALSTDKAASPINLYGTSKLAADKIFVAANNLAGDRPTRFSVVRYGNVIGSRGSVVPLFLQRVREGCATVPITDPRMTRFWITLQQGVDFVLSCLATMQGGEIFVPRIPSMGIADLARAIAPELPQEIIGIRPGEKLHELLIGEEDGRRTWRMEDRYVIEPDFPFWKRDALAGNGASRVQDGFRYASDTNQEWLDTDGLTELLRSSGYRI